MLEQLKKIITNLTKNQERLTKKFDLQDKMLDDLTFRQHRLLETFQYCALHLTYFYLEGINNEDVQNSVQIMTDYVYDNYDIEGN